jgi:hypothetical protein
MDLAEGKGNAHSFVVKVWREEVSPSDGYAVWRGHITHLPDGERRYIKASTEVCTFIEPHLAEMGVALGIGWRISRWLRGRKWGKRQDVLLHFGGVKRDKDEAL